MTMPIGPDFIALQVRDLAASAQFYKNVFGFEPEKRSPPGAVVLKTQPIALALREPLQPLPEAGPLGIGLALWVWPAMMRTNSTT
jgi:catechol 2,3-dioxygenase-like lactoylglutathione lyase family enzyme